MNRLQCLIRLARALDYNRDPDPKHWKTINGAHVHVDENGDYDGGAGGKFDGNHHYGGKNWKQKKESHAALSERYAKRNTQRLNVKGKTTEELKNQMKKAKTWGEWNRARGEINNRLQKSWNDAKTQKVRAYNEAYEARAKYEKYKDTHKRITPKYEELKAEYVRLKEKSIKCSEEAEKAQKEYQHFYKNESFIPAKIMEAEFENKPELAGKFYSEKRFQFPEMYPAYEKWVEKKNRTSSILKNLSKSREK